MLLAVGRLQYCTSFEGKMDVTHYSKLPIHGSCCLFRHIRFVAAGNGRRYGMAMAIGCGDGRWAHGEARAERIAYKHWRLGKLLQAAMGVYIMAVGLYVGMQAIGGTVLVEWYS